MRIVITKNGKILVHELEDESPSNIKSRMKSFQSSSYSRLPIIHTNEELLKKYSTKGKTNEFIMTLMRHKETSTKKRSNSLMDKKVMDNLYNRDDSKINENELNQAKKVNLSLSKLNISQVFMDKYDSYDENFKKKLIEFSNHFKKSQKSKEKDNNIEAKADNSNVLNNSNNNNNNSKNNNINPMDSNTGINILNNSSTLSLSKIKRINIGDIISKKNLYILRNQMSKYNKGSNDVRIPLDKENLRSFNFRSKYENKQATDDDMELILNYGINSDKSSIIRYFQQKKKISPQYFENLLKYDESQLYKLNKVCEAIFASKKKEKKKMKFFGELKDDKFKSGINMKDIDNLIKTSDSILNVHTTSSKNRKFWRLNAYKEDIERIRNKYWIRYDVDRFLKNKQKKELNNFSLSTKNVENKKLFSSQSTPNILIKQ